MSEPADLLRALVLLNRYTVHITQVASGALGEGRASNRRIALLLTLHSAPGSTPTQIAQALGADRSTVSRELRRLRHDGLISVTTDAHDRRTRHVRLSRAGAAQVRGLIDRLGDTFSAGSAEVKEVRVLLDAPPVAPAPTPDRIIMMAGAGGSFVAEVTEALTRFGVRKDTDRFVLILVASREDCRPGTIAQELGLSPSAATEAVDRLERWGLVQRGRGAASLHDGRVVTLRLTPRGTRAVDTALAVFARHATAISAALP